MKLEHESNMLVAEVRQLFLTEACHIDVVNLYRPCIWAIQRADNLQEGGLTSTAGTNDTHNLTFADMQVDAFQHLQRAEALGNILNIYHNFLAFSFLSWSQREILS